MRYKHSRVTEEEKWLIGVSVAIGIGALGAGIATLVLGRRNKEKSAKAAPQLKLDNPGTQSEFPTAATESEVG